MASRHRKKSVHSQTSTAHHPLLKLSFDTSSESREDPPRVNPRRPMKQLVLPIFGPNFPPPIDPSLRRVERPRRYLRR
jgi:hypothetical protein